MRSRERQVPGQGKPGADELILPRKICIANSRVKSIKLKGGPAPGSERLPLGSHLVKKNQRIEEAAAAFVVRALESVVESPQNLVTHS